MSAISPGALPKKSSTSETNSLEICKKHFCNYFFSEGFLTKSHIPESAMIFLVYQKHTALTIPVWSPTTVLGKPNPAWLRSSDGIRYIQGGMTVWCKSYFFITLIPPWIYYIVTTSSIRNSLPKPNSWVRHDFLGIFSLLLFQVRNSLPKPNSWVRHEFFDLAKYCF